MKIKDIINEEYKKILNEGYVMNHDNFKFRQEINILDDQKLGDFEYNNIEYFSNDFDISIDKEKSIFYVNWRIALDLNEEYIEYFSVQVDSVEGTYHLVSRDKQTDEISQEEDKNITEIPWKFQIYNDANLNYRTSLYVETIYFDFKTKICTVQFFNPQNQV